MPTNQYMEEFVTIDDACAMIGGSKPISRATYYRHVKTGRFPPPVHPSPGISRVRRPDLIHALHSAIQGS